MLPLFIVTLLISCKKESVTTSPSIDGQWEWTIQYADNPAFDSTPLSTGINETLSFSANGTYSLVQNGLLVNAGTYKTTTSISSRGESVPTVLYSNSRVRDSAAYFNLMNNGDSLVFSNDFIGTYGSGSRHYGKK